MKIARYYAILTRMTDVLSRRAATLGLMALIAVSALTVVDALLRRFYARSIPGMSDMVSWCIIIAVSACFPAMIWGHHTITVRILAKIVPWWVDGLLEWFGHVLLLCTIVIISWQLSLYSYDLWSFGEVSMLLLWPVWPVWAVACLLWWFTGLAQLLVVLQQGAALYLRWRGEGVCQRGED